MITMIPLQQNIFEAVLPWITKLDERGYISIKVPISQVPGLDEAVIRIYILNAKVDYSPGFVILSGCLKSDEVTQHLIHKIKMKAALDDDHYQIKECKVHNIVSWDRCNKKQ